MGVSSRRFMVMVNCSYIFTANPGLDICSLYVPGCNPGMRYDPISSLVVSISPLSRGPLSVMVAPTIARCWGSVTVPWRVDVVWAVAGGGPAVSTTNSKQSKIEGVGSEKRQLIALPSLSSVRGRYIYGSSATGLLTLGCMFSIEWAKTPPKHSLDGAYVVRAEAPPLRACYLWFAVELVLGKLNRSKRSPRAGLLVGAYLLTPKL